MRRDRLRAVFLLVVLLMSSWPAPVDRWQPVGSAVASHSNFDFGNVTIEPSSPNSSQDVVVKITCNPCTKVLLLAERGADTLAEVEMSPITPIVNGLTHEFIKINASDLRFGDVIRLTLTGEFGLEDHVLYHNFTIANSHPVASSQFWTKNNLKPGDQAFWTGGPGIVTYRLRNTDLLNMSGDVSVFNFYDKEADPLIGFPNVTTSETDYQSLTFNWTTTNTTLNDIASSINNTRSFRGIGNYSVRVNVSDGLNFTLGDSRVQVVNYVPWLPFAEARRMPASNSPTSTDPNATVANTTVVRVTVKWRDDDSSTSADRVYLDFYNMTADTTIANPNASREVSQGPIGATTSTFELDASSFVSKLMKICIRDVVNDLNVGGAPLPGAGTVLDGYGNICLNVDVIENFAPLDLRGVRIMHVIHGTAPSSTMGNVTHLWRNVSAAADTPEGTNQTILELRKILQEAMELRPRIVAIEGSGFPLTPEIEADLALLRDYGTLVIAPVDSIGFGASQYFTAGGIGSSRYVIGVAAANQSGNGAATGVPAGPTYSLAPKPDFLVALPSAAGSDVQAVKNVTDLAALLMLKGITDPFIVEEYLRALAVPAWNGVDTVENAWRQGHGVLNTTQILGWTPNATFSPENASAIPGHPAWASTSRLNHILDLAPVALTSMIDFGVTNNATSVTSSFKVANPSMALPSLLDQLMGSPRTLLEDGEFSTSIPGSAKTVRINTTFYYYPESFVNNASEAIRRLGHETALNVLQNSWDSTAATPGSLPASTSVAADVDDSLGSVTRPTKAYYFVPEETVNVSGSFAVAPTFPHLDPLLELAEIAANRSQEIFYHPPVGMTTPQLNEIAAHRAAILAARANMTTTTKPGGVAESLTWVRSHVQGVLKMVPVDPILKPLNETTTKYQDQLDAILDASIGSVIPTTGMANIVLETDASRTWDSPLGYYFGVVRVITDDVCDYSTGTGVDTSCRRVVNTVPTGLYLTRDVNITTRYRDGVAIPDALVEHFMLETSKEDHHNCDGVVMSPRASLDAELAGNNLRLQTVWRNNTGPDGNTTMHAVFPGLWCSHFYYEFPLDFMSNGTDALSGAAFNVTEVANMSEASPQDWGVIGLPSAGNYSNWLNLWGLRGRIMGLGSLEADAPGIPPVPPVRFFEDGEVTDAAEHLNEYTVVLSNEELDWTRDGLCNLTTAYNELFDADFDQTVLDDHLGECDAPVGSFQWRTRFTLHEGFVTTSRVRDNVAGTEWSHTSIPEVPAAPLPVLEPNWSFVGSNESFTATNGPLTNLTAYGAAWYDFELPENENVQISTSFQFRYEGVKGFYIIALGEDGRALLNDTMALLVGSLPASIGEPLNYFHNPLVRVMPFSSAPSLHLVSGNTNYFETNVSLENNSTRGNMTTYSEWATRAWLPTNGTVMFMYWRESLLSPALVRVKDYNMRIITYLGKEPGISATYDKSLGNRIENWNVNPKAEGWDVFVPTSKRVTGINVSWSDPSPGFTLLNSTMFVDSADIPSPSVNVTHLGFDDHLVMLPSTVKNISRLMGPDGPLRVDNGTWLYLGRAGNPGAPDYLEQRWRLLAADGAGAVDPVVASLDDPLGSGLARSICFECQDDVLDAYLPSWRVYSPIPYTLSFGDIVHDGIWLNTSFNKAHNSTLTWDEYFGSPAWTTTLAVPLAPVDHFVNHGISGNYSVEARGIVIASCLPYWDFLDPGHHVGDGQWSTGCSGATHGWARVGVNFTLAFLGGSVVQRFDFGSFSLELKDWGWSSQEDDVPDRVRVCRDSMCEEEEVDRCPGTNEAYAGSLGCMLDMAPPDGFVKVEYYTINHPKGDLTLPHRIFRWDPLWVHGMFTPHYVEIFHSTYHCDIPAPPGGCPQE